MKFGKALCLTFPIVCVNSLQFDNFQPVHCFWLRNEAVYPTFGAYLKHIFQRVHHFCLEMGPFTLPLELI